MNRIDRILVPIDFSPGADAALDYAAFLAARFDAVVDVLHVTHKGTHPGGEHTAGDHAGEIARRIEPHRDALRVHGVTRDGRPADVIVSAAKEGNYDLIVMGTHGRTGLAHMILGSVAESVVRHARCPVLTIRLDRHATTNGQ